MSCLSCKQSLEMTTKDSQLRRAGIVSLSGVVGVSILSVCSGLPEVSLVLLASVAAIVNAIIVLKRVSFSPAIVSGIGVLAYTMSHSSLGRVSSMAAFLLVTMAVFGATVCVYFRFSDPRNFRGRPD